MTMQAEAVPSTAHVSESKIVLITGAATGMGLAIAMHLLKLSHRIIAVDIDGPSLNAAYTNFADDRVLSVVADISDGDQIDRVVQTGVAHFGGLHALINNAALHGAYWNKSCLEYSLADWQRVFNVNVFAIPALTRAALPALSSSEGVVINMSSMVSYGCGTPSPYAVSKAAVNGLTIALAQEAGKQGVRVVGVAPGFISTPTLQETLDDAARERILSRQMMSTSGEPEDICAIMEFLISPGAKLITGTTIVADLGVTRRP